MPAAPKFQRAIILVADGVGCGGAPDAAAYGDVGADTLGNLARAVGGLALPNLGALGLGNLTDIAGVPCTPAPEGAWGAMREASAGKDTITGHWEMAGLVTAEAMATFPNGFPPAITSELAAAAGRGELARDRGREAVREGRHRLGGDEAGHLPVARDRVLAGRGLAHRAPRPLGRGGARHARDVGQVAEPEGAEVRERQPADGAGQVPEGVSAHVPVRRRVGRAPAPDAVGHEDDRALELGGCGHTGAGPLEFTRPRRRPAPDRRRSSRSACTP